MSRHQCVECDEIFSSISELEDHGRSHGPEILFSCTKCPKKYSALRDLKKHQRMHTQDKSRYDENLYRCSKCSKVFKSERNLKRHESTHSQNKAHGCEKCGKAFHRLDVLKAHQRVCSKNTLMPSDDFDPDSEDELAVSSQSEHFPELSHSGPRVPSSPRELAPPEDVDSSTQQPGTRRQNKPVKCQKNQRMHTQDKSDFPTHSGLDAQSPSRNDENLFQCSKCSKVFKSRRNLKRHESTHRQNKAHGCEKCGKAFHRLDVLKAHQRVCSKNTLMPSDDFEPDSEDELAVSSQSEHFPELSHSGPRVPSSPRELAPPEDVDSSTQQPGTRRQNKPVKCQKNQRMHTQDKSHVRDRCGESFHRPGPLRTHRGICMPYRCDQHGTNFSTHSSSDANPSARSDENVYRCSECPKVFKSKRNLKRHESTHTRNKAHGCEKCGMAFHRLDVLRAHQRICSKNALMPSDDFDPDSEDELAVSSQSESSPEVSHSGPRAPSSPRELAPPEDVDSSTQQPGTRRQNKPVKCRKNQRFNTVKDPTEEFANAFLKHEYGVSCTVCERLWFSSDVCNAKISHQDILDTMGLRWDSAILCHTCARSLSGNRIPTMAVYNGFRYPPRPDHLPPLNAITTRLISPRIPFMQIRRLRREQGTYRIIGQIINVPVDVQDMVSTLPRNLDDDYAFNVNLKKNLIHKTSAYSGMVKLADLKAWLNYLQGTTLYKQYGIQIDWTQFDPCTFEQQHDLEEIVCEQQLDNLLGQQQTLLWSEDKYLCIAPGQTSVPVSIIYDEHAEELSFPSIYFGEPREFRIKVTPFMIASSETRRKDRRGATPEHVLYMAAKIMRLKISQGLYASFRLSKGLASITRAMIEDRQFLEKSILENLAFFKTIPNSVQYWKQRKKELFSMIRQLGKPSFFLTMSANEMNWPHLLSLLHKIRTESTVSDPLTEFDNTYRAFLINEDSVTVCVYFWKLINVIMKILQTPDVSPFAPHVIIDYFIRIEYQHRGSPHAHVLVWLKDAPQETPSEHMPATVAIINHLCSADLSLIQDSRYHGQQWHHHTPTCYKNDKASTLPNLCRFHIPYWPCRETRILLPMSKNDKRRSAFRKQGIRMKTALETTEYGNIDHFLSSFSVNYESYLDIIRSMINRPTVVFKREVSQVRVNTFNPWIANVLKSNMDLQFILDEYSCATYVVEYVNKTNRGKSNLQKQIADLQTQYPDEDYTALLKRVSLRLLDTVEMTTQEAAWFLLRQPMSKASRDFAYIPSNVPNERIRRHKTRYQMEEEGLPTDSTEIWMQNIIEKYEDRPLSLSGSCLADFASLMNPHGRKRDEDGRQIYVERRRRRILSWKSYESTDMTNYKRSLVLLFVPFRNEKIELLDNDKFLALFEDQKPIIMERKQVYDRYMHMEQVLADLDDDPEDIPRNEVVAEDVMERSIYDDTDLLRVHNDDIQHIDIPNALPAVVKSCTDILSSAEYCKLMRKTNFEQRALIKHCIARIFDSTLPPVQIFFTGPAGCGKTFTLKLLMETYNRFARPQNSTSNAYVAAASTGKAAVAIGGTTVHSAFHICTLDRNGGLPFDLLHAYRSAFANVRLILIDEVSMTGAGTFHTINERLKLITHEFEIPFGGYDIVFCGDLRQLPPVKMNPIYEPVQKGFHRSVLWQSLKYYPLEVVMRQSDVIFSSILTKIGNGIALAPAEKKLIESRFRTSAWCAENVKDATRLFHRNISVDAYNRAQIIDGRHCVAIDVYSHYTNQTELTDARTQVHKKNTTETANLPYDLVLGLNYPYMITSNIDVADGLVNGAIGILRYVETRFSGTDSTAAAAGSSNIHCLWLEFTEDTRIGRNTRSKIRHKVYLNPDLNFAWTPIFRKKATFTAKSRVKCRRDNFPLSLACAMTVHKSQGGTFDKIVFDYSRSMQQQLVYVALSRPKSLEGLFLTNSKDDFTFYHATPQTSETLVALQTEMRRLEAYKFETNDHQIRRRLRNAEAVILNFNVQSLRAHVEDLVTDEVLSQATVLCLTETWIEDGTHVEIENYRLVAQSKRPGKTGGVAIYARHEAPTMAYDHAQPHTEVNDVGDLCSAALNISGKKTRIVALYINPNTPFGKMRDFLSKNRHVLNPQSNLDSTPMIVCGDFNWNVMDETKGKMIVEFMRQNFGLELISDRKQSTTRNNSCIDLIFAKRVQATECINHVSYFSVHRPVLLLMQCEHIDEEL